MEWVWLESGGRDTFKVPRAFADELARVRAERDALLAAFIANEPVPGETDNEEDGKWTAYIPFAHRYSDVGVWIEFYPKPFDDRSSAESAILAAAIEAARVRENGKGGA